jgi:hypothetical protein
MRRALGLLFALVGFLATCHAQTYNATIGTNAGSMNMTFAMMLNGSGFEHTFSLTGDTASLAIKIKAGQVATDAADADFSGSNNVIVPTCAVSDATFYVTVYLTDETVTKAAFTLTHTKTNVMLVQGQSLVGSLPAGQNQRIFQISIPVYALPVAEMVNIGGDNTFNFYAIDTCATQALVYPPPFKMVDKVERIGDSILLL